LTAAALAGTWVSTLALWLVLSRIDLAANAATHLGAVLLYHVVFAVAFARWSRPWVAREVAAVRAAETEAAPLVTPELLPWSQAFSILNSLGLIGLTLFFVQFTGAFNSEVENLLFG